MNDRPEEVDEALNILKAMLGTFSPQTFWKGKVTRPIENYIKSMEDEMNKRGVQANMKLAMSMMNEEDHNKDNESDGELF